MWNGIQRRSRIAVNSQSTKFTQLPFFSFLFWLCESFSRFDDFIIRFPHTQLHTRIRVVFVGCIAIETMACQSAFCQCVVECADIECGNRSWRYESKINLLTSRTMCCIVSIQMTFPYSSSAFLRTTPHTHRQNTRRMLVIHFFLYVYCSLNDVRNAHGSAHIEPSIERNSE